MNRPAVILSLLCALLVAGCATLAPPDPPDVRLANIAIERIGLFEQRYRVTLRVTNPNDRALDFEGFRFDLALNDRSFAEGVRAEPFELPAREDALIDVEVSSDLGNVLDLVRPWLQGERTGLTYRLSGTADLAGWPARIPFEQTGRIASP